MGRKMTIGAKADDALHALHGVVYAIEDLLTNQGGKLHAEDRALYYALWYWVKWGQREYKILTNDGGDN